MASLAREHVSAMAGCERVPVEEHSRGASFRVENFIRRRRSFLAVSLLAIIERNRERMIISIENVRDAGRRAEWMGMMGRTRIRNA